jgi:hypothetical protein
VFNPMEPPALIQGLGQVLREAAAASGGDDYRRSQLLSAYSLSRHLAAEQIAAPDLVAWLRERLDAELAAAGSPAAAAARATLAGSAEPEVGTVLARLFGELGDAPADAELRRRLHALLAELTDREVAVLAAAEA